MVKKSVADQEALVEALDKQLEAAKTNAQVAAAAMQKAKDALCDANSEVSRVRNRTWL